MSAWSTARVGEVVVGGLLAGLGLFIGIETLTAIPAGPSYAAVGPRAFPGLIGAGLVCVGLLLASQATRRAARDEDELGYDWAAVCWVVGSLASQMALLPWLGWVPAASLVFVGAARAFGSRSWRRDLVIGLVLAGGTFALFNFALGLDLPAGPVADWVRGR